MTTIDELFWKTAENLVDVKTETGFKASLKKLLGFMCAGDPTSIYIVSQSLADHLSGELWEKYRKGVDWKDTYRMGQNEQGMALFLQEVLGEFYPSADVKIVHEYYQIETEDGVLIVADRHCDIMSGGDCWDVNKWPHKARLFLLPFENAMAHLTALGKLAEQFDPLILYKLLRLEERLEKEKTK